MKKTLIASTAMLAATYAKSAMTDVTVSSLTAAQGFSVIGATASDGLGYTVINAGDVNADGKKDLLITTSVGKAYVVFGTGAARSAVVYDLADTTTNTDFITITVDSGVADVTTLVGAAGDVDGDGTNDIIIGAPGANSGDGQAWVIFGKSSLADVTLDESGALATALTGFSFSLTASSGKNFGSAISTADFNGDNVDDLLISAPTGTGLVYVIFGTTADVTGDIDLTTVPTTGVVMAVEGTSTGAFGTSVIGIADVNGDTYDDILVGAPDDNAAYIVYGTTDDSANIDVTDETSPNNALFAKISGTTGDIGQSVAIAGDFNDDGTNDLIIGAPAASKAYVIFGEQIAATSGGDITDIDVDSLGTTGITITGVSSSQFGYAVAGVDDVNDDDVDDIVITAYTTGKAYVLFGNEDIASIDLTETLDSQDGVTITGEGAGFGQSVSGLGDITGDGFADFVISAPTADPEVDSVSRDNAGAAYIIYGVEKSAFRIGASISLIVGFFVALMI